MATPRLEKVGVSLEQFRQYINSSLGTPARLNNYSINLVPPIGLATKFDSKVITMSCLDVNFPSKNIVSNSVRREHSYYEVPYGISYEPIRMTFQLDQAFKIREFFAKWYDLIYSDISHGLAFSDSYRGSIQIHGLEKSQDRSLYKAIITDAFPKSVSDIQYSASNQGDIATITVEFYYELYAETPETPARIEIIKPIEQRPPTAININELTNPDFVEQSLIPIRPALNIDVYPYLRDIPSLIDLPPDLETELGSFAPLIDSGKALVDVQKANILRLFAPSKIEI